MAINAYTGLMGSGKSYEAVVSVIVPAIRAGRTVVTNIDGINQDAIYAYLEEKHSDDGRDLGRVIHVSNDAVLSPDFFPDEARPDVCTVVSPGDLVVIDEAWRMWGSDMKIPAASMQFFRMHRHYTHSKTGVSCDVALVVQSVGDLHRSLRAVVEMTARMTKLKTIGLSRGYRIELFEGAKITNASRFDRYVKKYDPDIFPLYKSYAGGSGSESSIDSRQNILKNPKFIALGVMSVGFIVSGILALSYLYHKFAGTPEHKAASELESSPIPTSTQTVHTTAITPSMSPIKSGLRIAGEIVLGDARWVVVIDEAGRIRLENPAFFTGTGILQVGNIDGQIVASWTGSVVQKSDGFLK